MHLAEHFRGQAHHAGSLGGIQRQRRVRIHTVHHADVTHVLHTTNNEHITVTGHDRLGGGVQRAHGGATQPADSLRRAGVRNRGHQGGHAGDVPALLQGLVHTAPDDIFHFCRIDLRVALEQPGDQLGGQGLGTDIAVHPALGSAHGGAAKVDNYNVSSIEAHKFTLALSVPRLTEEFPAGSRHLTQLFSRVIHRAKLGVFVCNGYEFSHPNGVDVAQRAAPEGRETDTVDQTHVGVRGGFDDAIFQAAYGFQAQRYHHDLDDLFIGQLALLLHDWLEQFVGLGIDDLLRLALPVHFIGVEALAGLLAQAVGFVHDVDRSLGLVGHAVGVTLSHHVTTVVAGVHAHYVHQVRRTHGPADLFHDLVDALE